MTFVNRARPLIISSLLLALAGSALPFTATPALAQASTHAQPSAQAAPVRNTAKWNVKPGKPAIQGYDPVSYFPVGGGKPLKGDAKFEHTHAGVLYRFASAANRDAFKADPAMFEPAYGGWCAWAVHEGTTADIDPKTFVIEDGRLLLFYNQFIGGNTLKDWQKKPESARVKKADAEWTKMTGEAPARAMAPGMSPTHARAPAPVGPDAALAGVLNVGDRAPDFALPDAGGNTVSLADTLAKDRVVLIWYRGAWCPYCNTTLRAYQQRIADFKAAGATIIAISPQTPDRAAEHSTKESLGFAVLSDTSSTVATKFGVAYAFPDELKEKFKGYKLDLTTFNGPGEPMLPITATFIINKDGTIAWRHATTDYTKRAEPADVLAALKK